MPALYFLPWIKTRHALDLGPVVLEPYERGQLPGNQPSITQNEIDGVLSFYKTGPNETVQECILIRPSNRPIGQELDDEEQAFLRIFMEAFCFSQLTERRYFEQGFNYCCREDFIIHGHSWLGRFDGHIVIPSRRRDGRSLNLTDAETDAYYCPHNANRTASIHESPELLAPLLSARSAMDENHWGNLYECITAFNLANTDNALFTHDTEMVLLYGAFEALFRKIASGSRRRADFIRNQLGRTLIGVDGIAADSNLARDERWQNSDRPLIEHWLRDFKDSRGHLAHGGTTRNYPGHWSVLNHLMLGTFLLPLLVKIRLAQSSVYTWSEQDQAALSSFERLLQYDHFDPQFFADLRKRYEHPWLRIGREAFREASRHEIRATIEKVIDQRQSGGTP